MELHSFSWLFLIPLFPLLGAAYNGLLGARLQRRFGKRVVHLPAVLLPWGSFAVALWAFVTLAGQGPETALHDRLWQWLSVGTLQVDMAFLMDRLSGVMALVVTFVGSLIHVYSMGYMHEEPAYWRYFSYLNLFMFAMLVLVLGDSFLTMFIGWEGVGLCSYLLISFWYRDRDKAAAGMKAFVVNRIGDAGFLIGMALLFWGLAGSWAEGRYVAEAEVSPAASSGVLSPGGQADASRPLAHARGAGGAELVTSLTFRDVEGIVTSPGFQAVLPGKTAFGVGLMTLVCILLFIGACGKSAQIPLYVWLPDAMAGPTPVSALIHAATMVTAGVYMVARLHFLFALSPMAMTVVASVGAATALFAATIGLFQYDIKKVLAYSTVSQLGFMFIAVGVGAYWVGIFHLMTHAFFKACLFLGSGSVILGCHHEQDMRHMGGLRKLMPVTAVTYLLACCAIAGFPLFSGFFSKDEILWKAFDSGNLLLPGGGAAVWAVAACAALCTSFYMFRSYYMTFSGTYRGHAHPHESPRSMTWVLGILGLLSVAGGFVGLPHLWSLPNLFEHWLEPVFESSAGLVRSAGRGHSAEWALMGLSVVIAFAGFLAARALYRNLASRVPERLLASPNPLVRGVYRLVYNKYFVDELYDATVVRGTVEGGRLLSWFDANVVDGLVNLCGAIGRFCGAVQGWIDYYLVDGVVNAVAETLLNGGQALRQLQTGRIQTYVYGAMAGAVALVLLGYFIG